MAHRESYPSLDRFVFLCNQLYCSYFQGNTVFTDFILLLFPDGGTWRILSYIRPDMGETGENSVCWCM